MKLKILKNFFASIFIIVVVLMLATNSKKMSKQTNSTTPVVAGTNSTEVTPPVAGSNSTTVIPPADPAAGGSNSTAVTPPPSNSGAPNTKPVNTKTDAGDLVFASIQQKIYEVAEEQMKSANYAQKRRSSGSLPDGFPEELRQAAKEHRENKSLWMNIMAYPTELFKFCIYPSSKVSFVKWCGKTFFNGMKKKNGIK